MTWEDRLFWIWIVTAVLTTAAIVAILYWAIRTGQFRRPDRAARLPLEDEFGRELADEQDLEKQTTSERDGKNV